MRYKARIARLAVVAVTILVLAGLGAAQIEGGDESGVKRAVFTTSVVSREPVNSVDTLTTDVDKVYFFTEITGMSGERISHRWMFGGDTMAVVSFDIGGPRWRVYSSKTLTSDWKGTWTVEVVDSAGAMIADASFLYADASSAHADSM